MFDIKIPAINLKAIDYNESDKILTLLTAEKGLVSARIRGVKKAQAKLKFAAEPFCFADYELVKSKNSHLLVVGCLPKEQFYELRQDITKYYAGNTMLEFCLAFAQENEDTSKLFTLLLKLLGEICFKDADTANLLVYFLTHSLKLVGYEINIKDCSSCGKPLSENIRHDVPSCGFICGECNFNNLERFPPAAYKSLKFLSEVPLDKISTLKLNKNYVVAVLKLLSLYITNLAGKANNSLKEFIKLIK